VCQAARVAALASALLACASAWANAERPPHAASGHADVILLPKALRTFIIRRALTRRAAAAGRRVARRGRIPRITGVDLDQRCPALTSSPLRTSTCVTRPETWEASVP